MNTSSELKNLGVLPASGGTGDHRVVSLTLRSCDQPQSDPEWKTAATAFSVYSGAVLEARTDTGFVGYGYLETFARCADSWDGQVAALRELLPSAMNRSPFDTEAMLLAFDKALDGHSHAKAAIECAFHDITGKVCGQPLCNLLGGRTRTRVPAAQMVPLKSPAKMAELAQQLVIEGFRYLKLKLGGNIMDDVDRVATVRDRIGPGIFLSADINQGYGSAKEAIRALNRMEAYDLTLVEQPISALDYQGLRTVKQAVAVKIEADEALRSLTDLYRLVDMKAIDSANLRVNELGGIRNVLAAVQFCEMAGLGYRVSAFGPQLTTALAVHLGATARTMHFAPDLGIFRYLLDDPFSGIAIIDGEISVPDRPGVGVIYENPYTSRCLSLNF